MEFRPISLIHGLYNIVEKLLSSRLHTVMATLINPHQITFISGRQILDGFIITFSCTICCLTLLNGQSISHLQYVDDTLVFMPNECSSLVHVKIILRWFELTSGLKVNFHKSSLVGINLDEDYTTV